MAPLVLLLCGTGPLQVARHDEARK